MNNELSNVIPEEKPKIAILSKEDIELYRAALKILGSVVCEEFLDIPKLPKDKYGTDGLFYNIPYIDDEMLYHDGNKRDILVVYKIDNRSSFCPLRISFDAQDENNFEIVVNDQSGQRTIKRQLISRKNGDYFTEIAENNKIKLSELLKINIVSS